MDHWLRDLRFAFRSMRRNVVPTAAAATSLALGIGACAAIFSAVDTMLLRPLPFQEAEALAAVWTSNPERGWQRAPSSVPDFLDWRREARSLELAAHRPVGVNLSGPDGPERLAGRRVSHGFFEIFRFRPLLGRTFRPDEDVEGSARVVVLSEGVWERLFEADPEVVGEAVTLDGEPYEVVGVMPREASWGWSQDLWLPFGFTGDEGRGRRELQVVGRIADGSSLEAARRELETLQRRLAETFPDTNAGTGTTVERLRDTWFNEGFRQGSLIAGGAVLLVLLIACANVANLLLARGAAREKELALRGALGAGRGRLVSQLLTESLVLATLGGVLGIAVAAVGIRGIVGLFPPETVQMQGVELSGRVLLFTAALTTVAAILFGSAPALQAAHPDLRGALVEGGRGGGGGVRGGRVRTALVVAEVSLSVVLLISAVLMVKAFVGLRSADMGFDAEGVVTMRLTLPEVRYPDARRVTGFHREVLARVAALPGVDAVGATSVLPMRGNTSLGYRLPTEAPPEPGRGPRVSYRLVAPGYFSAMDIELLAGRAFRDSDDRAAPRVAVVNERMASRHWSGMSPVGQRLALEDGEVEIVGVVEDTRDFGPDDEAFSMLYLPAYQSTARGLDLVVRSRTDPGALLSAVRAEVTRMDPDQPVYGLSTLEQILRDELSGSVAMAKVLGALAAVAFLLAAVGVYGVMAYTVSRRTREVGVRLALGARRKDVLYMVVRQGTLMGVAGVALGAAAALGATRLLAFFLYGVSPFDPLAFGGVTGALLATAVAASVLPALRATRVDPVTALRTD